jgi:aminoglycoside phosphotransferase (APT) family kinase protein
MHPFLTPFQQQFILSAFGPGAQIRAVLPFGQRTRPVGIRVTTSSGAETTVVLRTCRTWTGVVTEARLLPALAALGLPVPQVLAGPAFDESAATPEGAVMSLLSLLPGESLLQVSLSSAAGLCRAEAVLLEAVERLHALTEPLSQTLAGRSLPRRDLLAELDAIVDRGGEWAEQSVFQHAVQKLAPVLTHIQEPLVFTNGDYQPENILCDAAGLTGWLDFESAGLEDPHYGFAKYRVYDIHPLHKAGLVDRYLEARGLSEREFAPRMALRCLWTLQHGISPFKSHNGYRDTVLGLLHDALQRLA